MNKYEDMHDLYVPCRDDQRKFVQNFLKNFYKDMERKLFARIFSIFIDIDEFLAIPVSYHVKIFRRKIESHAYSLLQLLFETLNLI